MVDLDAGRVVHRIDVSSVSGEIFDVVPLVGAPNPTLAPIVLPDETDAERATT